jgi:hypothetical protein
MHKPDRPTTARTIGDSAGTAHVGPGAETATISVEDHDTHVTISAD